ncbi:auxin-responsive protein SAUR72-like [Fagus crenata]
MPREACHSAYKTDPPPLISSANLLRPDSSDVAARRPSTHRTTTTPQLPSRRADSFRFRAKLSRRSSASVVPEGYVPVYVGDEMEWFVVLAELLNHPVFVKLLNKSAQEYGYDQKGALRFPCHVLVFERVLEALRLGQDHSRDLHDLLKFG